MADPLDIAIHFDPAAGFEDAALALARRLFAQYDEAIDALALVPADDGDFALYLGGILLVSHRQNGRDPMVADVRAALAARTDPQ
jgi:predicted Rdx family selenoprotein